MKTQNENQTAVAGNQKSEPGNRKTAGDWRTALPLNLISPRSRWQSASLYLQADYAPLRSICHDRCVICGSRDWLLFERLDETVRVMDDVNELFRFWFAGLERKQMVCVCVDC